MLVEKVKNLLEFTCIFLYSNNLNQSSDYYIEKLSKYIGPSIKINQIRSKRYEDWSRIWGDSDEINSIFLYFEEIIRIYDDYVKESNGLEPCYNLQDFIINKLPPEQLISICEKYLCDFEKVNSVRYSYIHPLVKINMFDKYINKNIRYFKLCRVLNQI